MAFEDKMKAAFLYLDTNTWREEDNAEGICDPFEAFSPKLKCDRKLMEMIARASTPFCFLKSTASIKFRRAVTATARTKI